MKILKIKSHGSLELSKKTTRVWGLYGEFSTKLS